MSQGIIGKRFEITKLLGRGGMGDVYLGKDTQTERLVAIKRLKSDIVEESPEIVERFTREGELLRQLDHPNIVKVWASFQEDNNHYIIMEYVPGGSLRDLLDKETKLPIRRALEISLDIADALTRTHRLQITHRDIKPANVLLAEDGTPRLTDFGIARIGSRVTKLTETGALMGTYAYLSPEGCTGVELDPRTDIWSFGIMLYEMLAGRRPFIAASTPAMLIAILQEPTPDIREFREEVPDSLVNIIHQMLIKDRDQRIPSIRRVGSELESILFGLAPADQASALPASQASFSSRFETPSYTGDLQALITDGKTAITSSDINLPKPLDKAKRQNLSIKWAIPAVLVLLAFIVIFWLNAGENPRQEHSSIPIVIPSDIQEYTVLVAQIEPLGTGQRDVTRFIVDNLKQKLEREVSFSAVRIFAYPEIVQTHEEAQAIATANKATVMVWGNYNDDFIELDIELGYTRDLLETTPITREQVEQISNVRVHMTNERRESIAPPVLGVLSALHTANGDAYEVIRTLAILAELDVTSAEFVGDSAAAYTQRFFNLYVQDTVSALEQIALAQEIAPNNPMLYANSSLAFYRLGIFGMAENDTEGIYRLESSRTWTIPLYLEGNYALLEGDLDKAIEIYTQIIAARPDDWFPYNFRGALHYLIGDYVASQSDYEKAISLGPNANFPYTFLVMIALREADIPYAQRLMQEAVRYDPSLGNRSINATYGENFPIPFGPIFSAFGHLLLSQYTAVLVDVDAGLAIDNQLPELYLSQGLAYCNLEDYEAAIESYTQAIALAPDFIIFYLLRSEAYLQLDETEKSTEDLNVVLNSLEAEKLRPYIQAGLRGDFTCENFFNYQLRSE